MLIFLDFLSSLHLLNANVSRLFFFPCLHILNANVSRHFVFFHLLSANVSRLFVLSPILTELAQAVVDAGAVPLLVLCIQEPELSLKRIAASALSDICKHSPELAQTVVDAGAIAHLAQMILNQDAKLKVCEVKTKQDKSFTKIIFQSYLLVKQTIS